MFRGDLFDRLILLISEVRIWSDFAHALLIAVIFSLVKFAIQLIFLSQNLKFYTIIEIDVYSINQSCEKQWKPRQLK